MSGQVLPFRRPGRRRRPVAAPPAPAAADDREFAEVTRVGDQAEALVVRGLLESHGIHVLLRTRLAPSVHPFTVGDQGEVRVLVPRAAHEESRRLLARVPPAR